MNSPSSIQLTLQLLFNINIPGVANEFPPNSEENAIPEDEATKGKCQIAYNIKNTITITIPTFRIHEHKQSIFCYWK